MNDKPNYLGAFLKHPSNLTALLAAGCAAIFASMPMGWAGLGLVGAVALGTEALAALAIPSLPSFKAWVDREQHQQARSQRQTRLLAELGTLGDKNALATYRHMCGRVQALYQTADDSRTTLTLQDVDKLEDLTVDYLGLCVAYLSLRQRKDGPSEELLTQRIASLQAQLQTTRLPEDEARQLRSALAQYSESLQRARRLAGRRSALEATLLSMPDKMEEVYQLVITSPYSSEMGSKLEDSLARLRIAEEVAAEFDTPEPWELEPPRASKPAVTAMGAVQQAAQRLKV
ncbi:MAG: hypothetical protein ABIP34_02235 [Rhodoferax sp.]|uniref:hypothetical protein n=1 Tax=Rhodoferax sp. TaxID=50421 RepID=UPI003267DD70